MKQFSSTLWKMGHIIVRSTVQNASFHRLRQVIIRAILRMTNCLTPPGDRGHLQHTSRSPLVSHSVWGNRLPLERFYGQSTSASIHLKKMGHHQTSSTVNYCLHPPGETGHHQTSSIVSYYLHPPGETGHHQISSIVNYCLHPSVDRGHHQTSSTVNYCLHPSVHRGHHQTSSIVNYCLHPPVDRGHHKTSSIVNCCLHPPEEKGNSTTQSNKIQAYNIRSIYWKHWTNGLNTMTRLNKS